MDDVIPRPASETPCVAVPGAANALAREVERRVAAEQEVERLRAILRRIKNCKSATFAIALAAEALGSEVGRQTSGPGTGA